ncbi:MAG TPA: hypothetical protein VHC44_08415, partial [Verrucomicrobiae bacterium]|nr:hypothetical protein [Verrucomicrobiae bacterium]
MRRLRDHVFVSSWRRLIGVLALTALSVGAVIAQPANDNFTAATSLDVFPLPGTLAGDNTGASREVGEPLIVTNAGGASVWYSWTSPGDCVATFDTIGSGIDTLLGVYVGSSVDHLTLVAQDDNSGGGGASQVSFPAPSGTVFYIAVDGSNGVQGNFTLNWQTNAPTAGGANDTRAQATVLSGTSGSIFDFNLFATAEAFETAGGGFGGVSLFGTNSMWYTWTAPSDGVVTFDTEGSTFDTLLDVYLGTNTPTFFSRFENDDYLAKRTSQVSLQVSAGEILQISVNGFQGASGFIRLNWNLNPLPVNDSFTGATALSNTTLWNAITDNNIAATAEPGEPSHAGFAPSHSLWYKWVAPADGEVQMDTIGSDFDTVLAVYNGNSVSTLSQVAANDDLYPTYSAPGVGQAGQITYAGEMADSTNIPPPPNVLTITNFPIPPLNIGAASFQFYQPFSGLPQVSASGSGASGLRFNAKAGVTYYFAVDGKSGGAGQFKLSWGYHSSGVFKFAGELRDFTSGIPSKNNSGIIGGGITIGTGNGSGYPGMLLYQAAESEEFGLRGGLVNADQYNSVRHTVYNYEAGGVLVTITRVAGSVGRVTVGYSTVDGDSIHDHYHWDAVNGVLVPDGAPIALAGDTAAIGSATIGGTTVDYQSISGTLTFNDFEMSKTLVIPVFDDFGRANHNRDFSIVLFNPQLDPSESTAVSQPRLDPIDSQALIRILDDDLDPRGPTRSSL